MFYRQLPSCSSKKNKLSLEMCRSFLNQNDTMLYLIVYGLFFNYGLESLYLIWFISKAHDFASCFIRLKNQQSEIWYVFDYVLCNAIVVTNLQTGILTMTLETHSIIWKCIKLMETRELSTWNNLLSINKQTVDILSPTSLPAVPSYCVCFIFSVIVW